MPHLVANRGLLVGDVDPSAWLEALSRPMLQFARPQRWSSLDDAMMQLMERLDEINNRVFRG